MLCVIFLTLHQRSIKLLKQIWESNQRHSSITWLTSWTLHQYDQTTKMTMNGDERGGIIHPQISHIHPHIFIHMYWAPLAPCPSPPFPAADPPYLASLHLPLRIDSSQPNPILATKSPRPISRLLARYTPVAHSLLALQYCLCHTQKFDLCSHILPAITSYQLFCQSPCPTSRAHSAQSGRSSFLYFITTLLSLSDSSSLQNSPL